MQGLRTHLAGRRHGRKASAVKAEGRMGKAGYGHSCRCLLPPWRNVEIQGYGKPDAYHYHAAVTISALRGDAEA